MVLPSSGKPVATHPTAVTTTNHKNDERLIRHHESRLNYFQSLSSRYHTTVNVLGAPKICFRGNWCPCPPFHTFNAAEKKSNRYFKQLLPLKIDYYF